MIFHHFTTRDAVASILRIGIVRGAAPLSATRVARAVNLTTDSRLSLHGLDLGGHAADVSASPLYASQGLVAPSRGVFADKLEARVTVRLPRSDTRLKRWYPWARTHCDPGYMRILEAAPSPGGRAGRWWLYFGVVPPEAIIDVTDMPPINSATRIGAV